MDRNHVYRRCEPSMTSREAVVFRRKPTSYARSAGLMFERAAKGPTQVNLEPNRHAFAGWNSAHH